MCSCPVLFLGACFGGQYGFSGCHTPFVPVEWIGRISFMGIKPCQNNKKLWKWQTGKPVLLCLFRRNQCLPSPMLHIPVVITIPAEMPEVLHCIHYSLRSISASVLRTADPQPDTGTRLSRLKPNSHVQTGEHPVNCWGAVSPTSSCDTPPWGIQTSRVKLRLKHVFWDPISNI